MLEDDESGTRGNNISVKDPPQEISDKSQPLHTENAKGKGAAYVKGPDSHLVSNVSPREDNIAVTTPGSYQVLPNPTMREGYPNAKPQHEVRIEGHPYSLRRNPIPAEIRSRPELSGGNMLTPQLHSIPSSANVPLQGRLNQGIQAARNGNMSASALHPTITITHPHLASHGPEIIGATLYQQYLEEDYDSNDILGTSSPQFEMGLPINSSHTEYRTRGERLPLSQHTKGPQNVFELPFDICHTRKALDDGRPKTAWKKLRKRLSTEKVDDFLKQFISNRDIVIVVDNGSSMLKYWPILTFVTETLESKLTGLDSDGIDIRYTFRDAELGVRRLKGTGSRKRLRASLDAACPRELQSIEDKVGTDMCSILETLFNEQRSARFSKPTTLIVLTDALWEGTVPASLVEEKIVKFARQLEKKDCMERHYTIGFVRFGDDGHEKLQALDDSLKPRFHIR
ncbi:hypothetical protein CC78DRAFT_200220 [Lojkania enalia]|uniref:VWFA domain-containing protein n=1 Tax=Lojkania enalia TaxID=147567 RepID=A0A9P4KBX1_9PLEO|nr:hypothetical protein CC78DRAFT_200220 [Didymosphaeria enalia]